MRTAAPRIDVVMLHGAGRGAHDEDAALAESLARHLGEGFAVRFPRLPEEDADEAPWLPPDAAVLLCASEDDEAVPFAHRDRYATAIPRAIVRTTTGGHQLGGDLRVVADDIRHLGW